MSFSDNERTRAERMIGSSRGVLIPRSRIGHPEQDGHDRDSSWLQEDSELSDQLCSEASGFTRSSAPGFWESKEIEDFEREGGGCKILDQIPVVAGVRSSSVFVCGKRKVEGDESESDNLIGTDVRVTKLRSSPIVALQTEDEENQDRDNLESEKFCKPIVRYPVKQHRRDQDEGSPSLIVPKAIYLPEELVEKVLSMIPFPQILKTRVLNKSWYKNFSVSPDAVVFQNQVKAVSAKWKHFCPIILNIEDEWMVGYDREYNLWQKMSLGFVREGLSTCYPTEKLRGAGRLRGAGSLMCGVYNGSNVFVTNIVTKTWNWLPSRPDMGFPKEIHLLPIGSDAYQVLLITRRERESIASCQIYDSGTKSWTIRTSMVSTALNCSSSAYLNGVLYVMEYDHDDFQDIMKMVSYNVNDGTWTNIHHPFGSMLHEIETYELLVCQNHVMVVLHLHPTWWTTTIGPNKTVRNTLMVYKLDPVSLDIREVARGPPEPVSASCTLFASDNDSIYFGDPQVASSSVVELNVQTREWSCLPPPTCPDVSFKNKWTTFGFQPGMNPFVSV